MEPFIYLFSVGFFLMFETSPNLMLHHCLFVKLQKCFMDFPSGMGGE